MGTLLIYVGDEPTNKDVLYRVFPKLSVKDGKVLTLRENMQRKQLTGYVLTNWLDKPYDIHAVRLDDEEDTVRFEKSECLQKRCDTTGGEKYANAEKLKERLQECLSEGYDPRTHKRTTVDKSFIWLPAVLRIIDEMAEPVTVTENV